MYWQPVEEWMDFGGDFGLWQRNIAESPEGTARRLAVFDALAVNTGQAVLDLGCGGGHLVRDLALAVGDSGRVVGLDASKDQLDSAGFRGVVQRPIAFMNGTMHANAFARWAAKLVATFAIAKGVAEQDVASWLDQLEKADIEGRFGFVSVPVLTTAITASS